MQHIKRLTEPSEGGTAGLAEEFRKLSNPNQARRLKQGTGSLTHNRSKNRLANILPCKRLAQAGKVIFILHRYVNVFIKSLHYFLLFQYLSKITSTLVKILKTNYCSNISHEIHEEEEKLQWMTIQAKIKTVTFRRSLSFANNNSLNNSMIFKKIVSSNPR